MTRWRGVVELLQDVVHHGSIAVEGVHQRVARTPFDLAACVPPLAPGARWVRDAQSRMIAATYASIRGVNGAVAPVLGALVELAATRAQRRVEADPADARTKPGVARPR